MKPAHRSEADPGTPGSRVDGGPHDPERRPEGVSLWITGLSGAGKTTVALGLAAKFRAAGCPVVLLDGDTLRNVFQQEHAHRLEDRLSLASKYGRLCKVVAEQGVNVICATISMFRVVHDWNRKNIPGYCEVYLRVPLETLRERDPKGLYARNGRGEASDVMGVDLTPEIPERPDLVIDNHARVTAEMAVAEVWKHIVSRA